MNVRSSHSENQANPNALILGSVDQALEQKICRREKREAAAEAQRQKERDRVANEHAASQNSGFFSEEEEDGCDVGSTDDTESIDRSFIPSWEGHVRKRPKTVSLEIDVEKMQQSFSDRADHYQMSSTARCSVFTDFVVSGGGSLKEVPCSQSTMIRSIFMKLFLSVSPLLRR